MYFTLQHRPNWNLKRETVVHEVGYRTVDRQAALRTPPTPVCRESRKDYGADRTPGDFFFLSVNESFNPGTCRDLSINLQSIQWLV